MELELHGKIALVTGSSRGLGRDMAETLAAEGCDLMLTGRDEAALAEVTANCRAKGVKVASFTADLRQVGSPPALVAAMKEAYGRLDILVNNAGATKRGDFLTLSEEDWQDGFALKFFAHVRLSRAAWPLLCESQGSVVTIGGTGGRKPTADFTIGSSVNAACAAFAKALADRGKTDGVQVNAIHPGHMETDRLWHRLAIIMKETGLSEAEARERNRKELGVTRFGFPADLSGLVSFLVSPRGRWLHGATITMDGGEIQAL